MPVNTAIEEKVGGEVAASQDAHYDVKSEGGTASAAHPYGPTASRKPNGPDEIGQYLGQLATHGDTGVNPNVGEREFHQNERDLGNSPFEKSFSSGIDELVKQVPEIQRYPELALAIIGQADSLQDPVGTAQTFTTLSQFQEFEKSLKVGREKEQVAAPPPGILGDIGQIGQDVGGVYHDVNDIVGGTLQQGINQNAGEAVPQGEAGLFKGAGAAANETLTAAERTPVVGDFVKSYIGMQMDALKAAGDALYRVGPGIATGVGDIAGAGGGTIGTVTGNPRLGQEAFAATKNAVNSGFDFLQHQYRMLSLVQKEHGDGAMIQAALPFLIAAAGVTAATAFGGPEAGAEAGEELGSAAAAVGEAGTAVTPEVADAVAATAETTANMGKSIGAYWRNWSDILSAAKGDEAAIARVMPNAGRAMETITRYNPASLALRGAAGAGKFATSPAYTAGMFTQYGADKTIYGAEWKASADAKAFETATGRPGTIGSFVASFLPKSEATAFLADAVNFGSYFLLPDPMGAAGHTYSEAYSAQGIPGWMHKYMPGSGLDMLRAAYDSPAPFMRRVKNAIDFISEHNAGEIQAFNKDLTPISKELDDLKVYKTTDVLGKPMQELDKQATVDKVIEYFASAETAKKLTTTSTLPLRGMASMIHDMVRDVPLIRQFEKMPFNIEWEKGEVAGRTVYNAKIEAHQFSPEDPMAPYIAARMARQAFHLSKNETDHLANVLTHADPGRFRQLLKNSVMANVQTSLVRYIPQAILAGLKEADANELSQSLMHIMEEKVNDWVGTYGVDKRGEYAIGRDATQLSSVADMDTTGKWDKNTYAAGVYPEQFGPIVIKKFHDAAIVMRQIVNDYAKSVKETDTLNGLRYHLPKTGNVIALGADYTRDNLNHWINDKWFKPLALLSPAWAVRVSMSEFFLNVFRVGGFKRLAAFWADGAAKGDLKMLDYANKVGRGTASTEEMSALGHDTANYVMSWFRKNRLEAPPPKELTVLTAFVNTLRVGFDRGMVRALGQSELLDAATTLIYTFDGHLAPYGVLSSHGGDYDEMGYSGHPYDMIQKAANEAKPLQKSIEERRVVLSNEFEQYGNRAPEFVGMRHLRARFLQRTQWGPQLMDTYVKEFEQTHDIERAYQATYAKARELIDKYPHKAEAYRGRASTIADGTNGLIHHNPGDPLDNWAQAVARDTEGFVLGPQMPEGKAAGQSLISNDGVLHPNLARDGDQYRYVDLRSAKMIRDGQVPEAAQAFNREVHGNYDASIFNATVGPHATDWKNAEGRLARFTSWTHKVLLGKIVNGLSRNPTYVLDFAKERAILASYVDAGKMTQQEADVLAMQRAMVKTVSYIHNPSDKTMWDEHLRVIAPFFFAQMQAFRRAGRLAVENPGAFEQYIKLLLGMNKGIQSISKGGASFISIPFGMWGIPFQASLNSTASINPIPNAEDGVVSGGSGLDSFLNAITPRVGPIVDVPATLTEWGLIDSGHGGLAAEEARGILGPVAASQPIWSQLFSDAVPNAAAQHAIEGVLGYFGAGGALTQSYQSAQETVLENEIAGRLHTAWGQASKLSDTQVYNALGALLPSPSPTALPMTPQQARLAFMYATVMKDLKDPATLDSMVHDSNTKAAWLWGARALGTALFPTSISLGRPYQSVYNAYQAEVAAHPNNWIAAENAFLAKYPWALPVIASHSTSKDGVPWAESTKTLQWIDDNKALVDKYPAAAAALLPANARAAGYSQFATNTLVQLGLRSKYTPQKFLDNLVINMGNALLYNVVYPAYDKLQAKQSGGYSYNVYQEFFGTAASHPSWTSLLGNYYMPIWYYGNREDGTPGHLDDQTKGARLNVLSEFGKMASDPQYAFDQKAGRWKNTQDQAIYVAAQLAALQPKLGPDEASTSAGYTATVKWWNGLLDQVQKGTFKYESDWNITDPKGVGKALSYAIETIYRPFAQQYTDTGQPLG